MFMQPPMFPAGPTAAPPAAPPAAPRPDAAERTERHLSTLAELVAGAAQLAGDAMRSALRRSAAVAEAESAGLPPPPAPRPAGPAGPEPADLFCRLFDRVCRGIVLESKLAGQWADAGRDLRRERRIEPRRARVRQIMHGAVVLDADAPDRETTLDKIEDALEDDDVEELMSSGALLGDVIGEICSRYDLTVDPERLPEDARRRTRMFPFIYRAPAAALAEQGPDPP
jgi:hypothetical protein